MQHRHKRVFILQMSPKILSPHVNESIYKRQVCYGIDGKIVQLNTRHLHHRLRHHRISRSTPILIQNTQFVRFHTQTYLYLKTNKLAAIYCSTASHVPRSRISILHGISITICLYQRQHLTVVQTQATSRVQTESERATLSTRHTIFPSPTDELR